LSPIAASWLSWVPLPHSAPWPLASGFSSTILM
jgi:hypothetical protein